MSSNSRPPTLTDGSPAARRIRRCGLRAIAIAACLALPPAHGATLSVSGFVNPQPEPSEAMLDGTDLAIEMLLEIDGTVPTTGYGEFSGWGFLGVVTGLRVTLDTSGLGVPGGTSQLIWDAPAIPEVYSVGLIGTPTIGYGVVLHAQPFARSPGDDGVELPQFPGAVYYMETIFISVTAADAIPGFTDPPLAAQFVSIFPHIDPGGPNILGTSLEVFLVNPTPALNPLAPETIYLQGPITALALVPVPPAAWLAVAPLWMLAARRRAGRLPENAAENAA